MEKIIERSNEALDMAIAKSLCIPAPVWKHCKGVAIVNCTEIGFVVSITEGDGVVLKHCQDGSWGPPSAISFDGSSAGVIFGKGDKRVFLFPMTDNCLKVLAGGATKLGLNLGIAAGPGLEREVATNLGMSGKADVTYAYTFDHGALISAGLGTTSISPIPAQNEVFYGKAATPLDIVTTPGTVEIPKGKGVEGLHEKLAQLSKK